MPGRAWFTDAAHDFRYAARTLRRNTAFAAAATVTLSLAIGANTATFSVINAVLLRPLPYSAPDQLAMLWTENPAQNLREGRSALSNVEHWRRQSRSFVDMAVFDAVSTTLTGTEGAEQIPGAVISANLLPLLGTQPLHGRNFTLDDEMQEQRVVLISHSFWRTRFGGAHRAIGATLVLNGFPFQIVGILPPGFRVATLDADVWHVQRISGAVPGGGETWFVIGRLQPGVAFAHAQSEMALVAARLNDRLPAAERSRGISVVPLTDHIMVPQSRQAVWMLGGAVLLVFLIAAANVAGLTLARSAARAREMAVRIAIGASAGRIVRQLLAESVLLGMIAGVFGTVLAWAGIRLIRVFGPDTLPRVNEVALDLRVLGIAIALSLVVGVLVGLGPARVSVVRSGKSTSRMRRALVVSEFAVTIILLVGAALLLRSWWNVTGIDTGFTSARVLVMELSTPPGLDNPVQRTLLYESVLEQIRAVPGVATAGIIGDLFIANSGDRAVTVERAAATTTVRLRLRRDEASADFFKAIGTSLLGGRVFSNADGPDAPAVAVINRAMARRLWSGEDPVGRRFTLGANDTAGPWYTVVGVVADMRRQGPEHEPLPQMFDSLAQNPPRSVDLVIRTATDGPLAMAAALRAAVRRVVKDAPVYGVAALDDQLARYLVRRRFETSLLTGFSFVALLLAVVGIYGLLQYSIVTRTPEIAVRIAIGARAADIFRMVILEGLTLSVGGIAIGLVGARWFSHAASNLLFGVAADDTLTFTMVSMLLAAIALIACYFPARRAMHIDPAVTLRSMAGR